MLELQFTNTIFAHPQQNNFTEIFADPQNFKR